MSIVSENVKQQAKTNEAPELKAADKPEEGKQPEAKNENENVSCCGSCSG